MNILQAMDDPAVFGQHFRTPQSWEAWRALLAALFGLSLTDDQHATYRQCTGRSDRPSAPAREGWFICGRRAGKSFVLALIAVFLAAFRDWRPHLAVGERATIMVIAADRRQARTILRYVTGLLKAVPMLAALIESERADGIDLGNGITIEIHTASFRTTRGYSIASALLDELAFWDTNADAAEPDYEIIAALRPGMATIPGAMLLCASSPYAKKGSLYNAHQKHFGKDGDAILVWQADTRTMNPTVPQSVIDEATELDPASAAAEYGAQFRSDLEAYISREVVLACVGDYFEMPPVEKQRYFSFCDPAGGSGTDSFTLAIAHKENDRTVVDCLRETRPPFSPEAVVDDFARVLKSYRVSSITGDRFGGEWPREQFRTRGITYRVAAKVRSDLYRDLLPVLNSGRIVLPKSDRLINQLTALERHTGASGRDRIDHRQGAHDDLSNVVAGVSDLIAAPPQAAVWGVGSWNNSGCWRSDGKHVRPQDNVANEQSQPDSAVHAEPTEVDEKHFRVIRDSTPRIW